MAGLEKCRWVCRIQLTMPPARKLSGAAHYSPWVPQLKLKFAFAALSLFTLGTPAYAQLIDQGLCVRCLATAKAELTKCLEAAISQEDKKSCQEKRETHAKTCENECKIEKAAETALIREGKLDTKILPRE